MATCIIALIGIGLDIFMQTTIIASVGATVFILFTMPHTKRARGRYIIGGYLICTFIGIVSHAFIEPSMVYMDNLIVAVAVGISIFVMTLTNTEHPPAVAFSMGIVIDGIEVKTLIIVGLSIVLVVLAKKVLAKWMIDLL